MTIKNFLAEFIQEPIYVINEKDDPKGSTQVKEAGNHDEQSAAMVEEAAVPLASPPTPLPTKGENLKHCIILVKTDVEVIGAADEAFLYKILGAVKRQANDVLIANVSKANQESINALLAEHNHRHLIGFGLETLPIPGQSSLYETVLLSGKQYLLAEDLSTISEDKEKKKALWKALQSMFL